MLIYHLSGSHMREPLFSVSGALFGTSLRKTLITIIMKETSISLFKGYSDTHPQDSTLQEIVNLIRNDALVRDRTEKHRYYSHNGQKAAAAWEKAACPCFAVAVCFGGGKQARTSRLDFAGAGRHRPYRRRPPAGTNRTCPRRQAYAADPTPLSAVRGFALSTVRTA